MAELEESETTGCHFGFDFFFFFSKLFCVVQEQYGLKIIRKDKQETTVSCILVNLVHRVPSTYKTRVVEGRNKGNVGKRWEKEMYFGYFRRLLIAPSKLSGKKSEPIPNLHMI